MTAASSTAFRLAVAAVLSLVVVAYANHWSNPFHFDDEHTIVQNPNVRSLANLPRFLTDATAASIYPTHAVYRPVTYATLIMDYAAGGGLTPWVFHLSTFVAFLALAWTVFVLACAGLDRTVPGADHRWSALFGAAIFALHPVSADTVNYIIQRAEVWAALGTVGAVALYAVSPRARRYGWFVVPGVLGIFAKTTASIFPFLVLAYHAMVERRDRRTQWISFAVATAAAGAATGLCGAMTYATGTFDPGGPPPWQYRWTQPWVIVRYVRNFFLPIDLSIDPGWAALASPFEARAIAGYVAVALIVSLLVWLARRPETGTIAFGLTWFLVALVPVSVFPLAELTNDHRMFLPFAGLAIASAGVAERIWSRRWLAQPSAALAAAAVILVAAGAGTWQRNQAWASNESAWRDALEKNPSQGRAHMNLGVALMSRGALAEALAEFEQAAIHSPNYAVLEVNLGVVKGALGRTVEAEPHFKRAIELTPNSGVAYLHYGIWLRAQRRYAEAVWFLERAVAVGPHDIAARHELLRTLSMHRSYRRLKEVAADTLQRVPGDSQAQAAIREADAGLSELSALAARLQAAPTADGWLDLSLRYYNEGNFPASLESARQVLTLQPDSAEAYNNIAAAHAALKEWPEAIAAAQRALALKPDFALARNNLAWAMSQAQQQAR